MGKKKNVLFKSKVDPWYFIGFILYWLVLIWITPESEQLNMHKIPLIFLTITYILLGYRYSFESNKIQQYYLFKGIGREIEYSKIVAIEYRDRSAPLSRPIIILHFKERTIGRNGFLFRFFYVSRKDADKIKLIADNAGVKWYHNT